jgi:NADPH2:quinone reductase
MKAVLMTAIGGPETLQVRDVPEPQIDRASQVKIRLHAAGINPVDAKIRQRGLLFDSALPAILGCDGAGEIVELGSAVDRFKVGDRVWLCHGGLGREPGNYAQYTVAEQTEVASMPSSIDFDTAAAGPLVLITAWEALHDRARLSQDQSVLIHGGAGGVGHVAVQLAKAAGARVITTVSSPQKAELARSLGADETIDYRSEDVTRRVLELSGGEGVNIALETVGPQVFRQSIPCVAHYGDLITLLDPGTDLDWKEARNRNLRIGLVLMLTPMIRPLPEARRRQIQILAECARLIDAGRLRLQVGEALDLEQAAEGHRRIESGHTSGKIVLKT